MAKSSNRTPPSRKAPARAPTPQPQEKVPIPRAKRARPDETKREKFLRIGQYRTRQALHAIALLRPLSATTEYEWTRQDATLLVTVLQEAVDKVATAFATIVETKRKPAEEEFSFLPLSRH